VVDTGTASARILDEQGVERLLADLLASHDRVLGPVVRDGAVVYDVLDGPRDLVRGARADQGPGRYRLGDDPDGAWFAWAAPAQSLKPWVLPSRELVATAARGPATDAWAFAPPGGEADGSPPDRHGPVAAFGVRACDLAGLDVLERVMGAGVPDPGPASRRPATLVAVACTTVTETCFCASLGTGPTPEGADVALTELVDGGHRFVAVAGTGRGATLLDALDAPVAGAEALAEAAAAVGRAAGAQVRALDVAGLPGALRGAAASPAWSAVATRCLTCGSCTSVCPTCFCSTVEDGTDPGGTRAERWEVWDSCFTLGFSELHGGSVRTSGASRYRQWLTHKLDTWFDQFGEIGCVGCGRCITWCPVGIDLVAEAAAARADPGGTPVALRGGRDQGGRR
jgi:sulfhydrogenase subunit beta (sulfur reductase)